MGICLLDDRLLHKAGSIAYPVPSDFPSGEGAQVRSWFISSRGHTQQPQALGIDPKAAEESEKMGTPSWESRNRQIAGSRGQMLDEGQPPAEPGPAWTTAATDMGCGNASFVSPVLCRSKVQVEAISLIIPSPFAPRAPAAALTLPPG